MITLAKPTDCATMPPDNTTERQMTDDTKTDTSDTIEQPTDNKTWVTYCYCESGSRFLRHISAPNEAELWERAQSIHRRLLNRGLKGIEVAHVYERSAGDNYPTMDELRRSPAV